MHIHNILYTSFASTTHLCGFDLPDRPGHETLQDRPAVVVQQVNLVDDHQADELRVGAVACLPGDDVPLLRSRDDYLPGHERAGRGKKTALSINTEVLVLWYDKLINTVKNIILIRVRHYYMYYYSNTVSCILLQ